MATSTITPRAGLLPDGTAVGLFKRTAIDLERQVGVAPIPSPVTSGVMAEGKFTTEATLEAIDYVLVGFVDEVQAVKVDATSGKFKLTFEGQAMAEQVFNVSTTVLREALEALSNIAPGDVEVTGGPGNSGGTTPFIVKFKGAYAGTNVAQMTAANGSTPLAGGGAAVSVSTSTQGSTGGAEGIQRYCLWSNKS